MRPRGHPYHASFVVYIYRWDLRES